MSKSTEKKRKDAMKAFEAKMKNAGVTILRGYVNAKEKVEIMCSCGHKKEALPNSIVKSISADGKIRCRSCSGKNSHKKMSSDDWTKRGLDMGFKSLKISKDMSTVEAIGSCGHEIKIKIGGLKKKMQKGVTMCRACSTKASRDMTLMKMKTLLRNNGCNLVDYDRERRMCTVNYSCGHNGEESLSSLQRKARDNGKIECTECIIRNKDFSPRTSKCETELLEFVSSLRSDTIRNYRESYPRGAEIDVFVPGLKIGFEMNGMYWHSVLGGKDSKYHIDKTEEFESKGIKVIHIYEHEWYHKRKKIMMMIESKLGLSSFNVNGRDCVVEKISASRAKSFFDENHIQGGVGSSNDSYALKFKNNIVSVMGFRNKNSETVELYRFASILGFNVRGGFSKLLAHYLREKPQAIKKMITYADIRFSGADPEKTVYAKNGFVFKHKSSPNYKYFRNNKELLDRRGFMKHLLKDKLDKFDSNLTEWENMKNNGYNKIYDCGNLVFEKIL